MLSAAELDSYIRFARSYKEAQSESSVDSVDSVYEDDAINSTLTNSLGFGGNAASSATSYTHVPHAVSKGEAQSSPIQSRRSGTTTWAGRLSRLWMLTQLVNIHHIVELANWDF